MTFAAESDVLAVLRRELEEYEPDLIAYLLPVVEEKIRARLPDLDGRVAAGIVSLVLLKHTEAEAIARVLRNPEGFRMEMEGNYSYQIDSRAAAGFLTILDTEWRELGVGSAKWAAPATDGYLAGRNGGFPPAAILQWGWPGSAGPGMAETWGGGDW